MCPHRKGLHFEFLEGVSTTLNDVFNFKDTPSEAICNKVHDEVFPVDSAKDSEDELYATQSTPEISSLCDSEESDLRQCLSASAFSNSTPNLSESECSNCRARKAAKRNNLRSSKLEVDWNPDVFIRTVDDSDGESVCSGGGISWEPRGKQLTKKWTRNEDPELSHPYMHTPYTAKHHIDAQLERCSTPEEGPSEDHQISAAAPQPGVHATFATHAIHPSLPFMSGMAPYLHVPFFHPCRPFRLMQGHMDSASFVSNVYESSQDEMKVDLAKRVVEYMNGADTNPERKPLASEKVQNIIKANNVALYENVVDQHYGCSWHRFLHDPIFADKLALCSIDVNRWFIRVAHDEDWKVSLQESKMERSSKDDRIRSELATYIKKQPNGSCTAEEFLNFLLRADQDPSIPLLFGSDLDKAFPRRGQFVRFVKRNSKWFTYDPSSFAIRINEHSGAWDRLA